jgi:hypothetical protein
MSKWKKVGFIMRSEKETTLNICINDRWCYARISDFMKVIDGTEKFADISEPPRKEGE